MSISAALACPRRRRSPWRWCEVEQAQSVCSTSHHLHCAAPPRERLVRAGEEAENQIRSQMNEV